MLGPPGRPGIAGEDVPPPPQADMNRSNSPAAKGVKARNKRVIKIIPPHLQVRQCGFYFTTCSEWKSSRRPSISQRTVEGKLRPSNGPFVLALLCF